MNKKGSMNKEELDNYFMNNFVKLWPDKADRLLQANIFVP
jgi:hypothetical protein